MRPIRFLLVIVSTLLAGCTGAATTTKNELTIATTNATATIEAIEKFFAADAKLNQVVPTDEEGRLVVTSGIGARVGIEGTGAVLTANTEGSMVTVTIYNNNGLWQRFEKWWDCLFT